jgi:hypothetical protein
MNTPPVRVERRVGQRFPYLLSLSLRQVSPLIEGLGFSQDLSSRGVFFFTDAPLQQGAAIEITLCMPSEITLGENMRVRCRGRILRVVKPAASLIDLSRLPPAEAAHAQTKIGVAVRLEGYEYLPDAVESSAAFARVSALHSQPSPLAEDKIQRR